MNSVFRTDYLPIAGDMATGCDVRIGLLQSRIEYKSNICQKQVEWALFLLFWPQKILFVIFNFCLVFESNRIRRGSIRFGLELFAHH